MIRLVVRRLLWTVPALFVISLGRDGLSATQSIAH